LPSEEIGSHTWIYVALVHNQNGTRNLEGRRAIRVIQKVCPEEDTWANLLKIKITTSFEKEQKGVLM
jgi:hypothetical protein